MIYVFALLTSFAVAAVLVPWVRKLAFRIGAVDKPSKEARKIHRRTTARAGGVAIAASFLLVNVLLLSHWSRPFIGLVVAGLLVLLMGLYDDIHNISPWIKLIGQIIAATVAVVGFGIGIETITNPLGGTFNLAPTHLWPTIRGMSLLTVLFSVGWLVLMTNTINLLDGLDGLSGGVGAIAAVIIFFLSITDRVNQPDTALIAIVLAGACLGYLIYNFYPASIFNGDSGAYFLGMTLGVLSIVSGAKLATLVLVLGIPLIDAIWAFLRRIAKGRSPFSADRGHFHFLLLDAGLSQRQAVLIIYAFSIVFGALALVTTSPQKLIAIVVLLVIVSLMILILTRFTARHNRS